MLEESLKVLSLIQELKNGYNGHTHSDPLYDGFLFEKKNKINPIFNKIISENEFDLSKIEINYLPHQLQFSCVKTGI